MNLTKSAVKSALGIETDAELARFFEIGRWAVGQWPDDKPIPERRQWELRARRPDLFTNDSTDRAAAVF
ncbi:hypothetical protein [Lysobacter sp. CA199]|uniref:hypothetical protein n=1 Tax=Lysobacter sp. CA199 TaxID=3455608 RepID=UPI003F8D58DA